MTDAGRRGRELYGRLALLLTAGVIALSFLPLREKQVLHTKGRLHEGGHLILFGAVAFLSARSARGPASRVILFLASLAFGLGIEYAEHAFFHGALEWTDVLIDATGVVAGTVLARLSATGSEDHHSL